ncbi:MAG: peptidoglycan DD-metalloendopeptidase family protein [Fimbriimonadaceae bacterium]|nr:peptidoglycan DD-metalloendopeptidase family protein [Fimbriimonadaceae bacterium]
MSAKPAASSVKSLKAKRAATVQKREVIEQQVRAARSKQRVASASFHESARTLADAESDLSSARSKLRWTENRIHGCQERLDAIKKNLEVQTSALWKRLELFYKQGSIGYVEVLLGAQDYDQFVDRAVFVRGIAAEDLRLKQHIEESQQQQAALKAELQQRWIESNSLRKQCASKAETVRVEAARKYDYLATVKRDRAAKEAAYEEIVETQREIDAVLWRINRRAASASSGGSGGPVRRLSGGFILPCNGRFSSRFGWRTHPILGTRRFHDGQDIAAPHGTTIRAAAGGTVVHAGWMKAYGNTVMVSHGGGYTTLYGHCSSLLVRDGQAVSQGQPIARVGSTGWSTGPHLHWSVYHNGSAVNPLSVR